MGGVRLLELVGSDSWPLAHCATNPGDLTRIANAFFRAGLIESWGRGIEKMENECRNHGIPIPELKYLPSNFMLKIDANELMNKILEQNISSTQKEKSRKKGGQKRWSEKVVKS
jgi:predicted HTH transcriptional regulator